VYVTACWRGFRTRESDRQARRTGLQTFGFSSGVLYCVQSWSKERRRFVTIAQAAEKRDDRELNRRVNFCEKKKHPVKVQNAFVPLPYEKRTRFHGNIALVRLTRQLFAAISRARNTYGRARVFVIARRETHRTEHVFIRNGRPDWRKSPRDRRPPKV